MNQKRKPRKRSSGTASRRPRRAKRSVRAWLERHGLWVAAVRITMWVFILAGLALVYLAAQLPSISALETIKKQQGITVLAADGHVVANYGDVYGTYVPYEQLPKALVYAVIATEDRRFFEHHGMDFIGIARAMVTNIRHGRMLQGGSTVTQQVAKNVFLTPERTLKRKLQELMLAFWLEARFSKKEIMAIYLNRVYLGGGSYGVDAAAKRYYNKSARELNLYESAQIAGMLKAPSRYNPAANSDRAQARVHQVLLNMVDAGYLREKDVKPTLEHYSKSSDTQAVGGGVRYYSDWIVDQLPELIGDVGQDLVIATTLDTKLQGMAQEVLQQDVTTLGEKKNVSQGAIVVMRPEGAVLAVVGGLDYGKSQYNRAVQAKRQPGSSFKLFVYLAALEAGLTPLSTVEDAPITIQVGNKLWSPNNFESNGYRGEIPMVEAIRYSLNTVSVRLSQYTGVGSVAEMAMRLGLPNIPAHPSIALGAVEATLLEMTQAYAHLPNGGNKVEAYGITRITTRSGQEIYKHEAPEQPNPVLAKGTVAMMNYMLKDVATRGTGAKAALKGYQAAGKTGTSQDYKDAWFIGFTPQLVAGVWVGNDNNKSMKKITGGAIPAAVWHDFMTRAMEGMPVKEIPASEGSGEGLLPWLFGGSTRPEGETPPPPVMDKTSSDGTIIESGIPVEQPISLPPGEATPPATAEGEEVLTPSFWEKLEDKVPPKEKFEHTYPSQKRRR